MYKTWAKRWKRRSQDACGRSGPEALRDLEQRCGEVRRQRKTDRGDLAAGEMLGGLGRWVVSDGLGSWMDSMNYGKLGKTLNTDPIFGPFE